MQPVSDVLEVVVDEAEPVAVQRRCNAVGVAREERAFDGMRRNAIQRALTAAEQRQRNGAVCEPLREDIRRNAIVAERDVTVRDE